MKRPSLTRKIALLTAIALVATSSLWRPKVEPSLVLASSGDLSSEHAALLRGVLSGKSEEAISRYFDEVPDALEKYRRYIRLHPGQANGNVRDPEVLRLRMRNAGGFVGGLSFVDNFDRADYDLVASQKWHGELDADDALEVLLAVDFARATREALSAPKRAESLVTLVRWGVPRGRVEAAIERLPGEEIAGEQRRQTLLTRLILEDQTLTDPLAELKRRGLPEPVLKYEAPGRYEKPKTLWPILSPFPPNRRMNYRLLLRAKETLRSNPKDVAALDYLRRGMRHAWSSYHSVARGALVGAGDPVAEAEVMRELRSSNAATALRAMTDCLGLPGARLLLTLRESRYPWLRMRAASKLLRSPDPGIRKLASAFAEDPARDVRRLVREEAPYAIGLGTTRHLLVDPGDLVLHPGARSTE